MMTGFNGMETVEGLEVAQQIKDAGQKISAAFEQATAAVGSVDWKGPDYETFHGEWSTFRTSRLQSLVTLLQSKGQELDAQAQAQDATSEAV